MSSSFPSAKISDGDIRRLKLTQFAHSADLPIRQRGRNILTGPGYQIAYGVDVDPQGNIYVTGTALGDVFGGTGAAAPDNSNLNVFLLVFRP